jgi:nitrite reductase/ring-hydroxylating ferredoxin subunit/uncharacterized membrane protein
MLVAFPAAYLFGSACIDVWARATNRPRWFRTASHLNLLGIASALAAAVPGLIDYVFAVPPKSTARDRATNHMLANVSALACFAAARASRHTDDDVPRLWALVAELAGLGLVTTGGWLGGTLVYRNQIGVDHRYANAGKWRVEPRRLADAMIDVAASDELQPGQMKLLRLDDERGEHRIVLARTAQGYAAFQDRCTHRGGSLADGALVGCTVQCPWHGSQFDVMTGRIEEGPAKEPIATYAVEERDGRVWLRFVLLT